MNLREELLTNWWSEFLVRERNYGILIRNFIVDGCEYDGVGIVFPGNRFTTEPLIENIETKFAALHLEQRAARKLIEQIEKKIKKRAFNSYIGLCNSRNVVVSLPCSAGKGYITLPEQEALARSEWIAVPPSLAVRENKRQEILSVAKQLYSAAAAIGMPCIFAKCQRRDCRYYYAFKAHVPLPDLVDESGHSDHCPRNPAKRSRFVYMRQNFHMYGATYPIFKQNRMT